MRTLVIIRNPEKPDKLYEIEMRDRDTVWIGTEEGEGMELDNQALFDCIDKLYKENF